MKLPAPLSGAVAGFDRLAARERVLLSAAIFVIAGVTWMTVFQDPIAGKQRTLAAQISSLENELHTAAAPTMDPNDPVAIARAKAKDLQEQFDVLNKELAATAGGLIPPERMVQVVHDVLSRHAGVVLVSLRNKPVVPLIAETPASSTEPADRDKPVEGGPYIHPMEIVVEGSYLDVLQYLKALEALPWHFYWKVLQLDSGAYPLNRVRIDLSTLSMDKEWLSV
jgi:MSHA biogenesis protein MshJ